MRKRKVLRIWARSALSRDSSVLLPRRVVRVLAVFGQGGRAVKLGRARTSETKLQSESGKCVVPADRHCREPAESERSLLGLLLLQLPQLPACWLHQFCHLHGAEKSFFSNRSLNPVSNRAGNPMIGWC